MNCTNCGAALPAQSDTCKYCSARNDTDLRRFDVQPGAASQRVCPRCDKEMGTLTILLGKGTNIERCDHCLGIFFDRHELQDLLAGAIEKTYEVDYQRLAVLAEERKRQDFPVGYVKCPVCRELMYRRAFGAHSGVVVDTCKEHGLWLDQGELGTLLRWAQVGGLVGSAGHADLGWEVASTTAARDAEAGLSPVEDLADSEIPPGQPTPTGRRRPLEALGALSSGASGGSSLVRSAREALGDTLRFLGRLVGISIDIGL